MNFCAIVYFRLATSVLRARLSLDDETEMVKNIAKNLRDINAKLDLVLEKVTPTDIATCESEQEFIRPPAKTEEDLTASLSNIEVRYLFY